MKRSFFFIPPLLIVLIVLVALGAATLLPLGRVPRGDTIYSASVAAADLARNPRDWAGRTVLVHGDLHLTGGVTPAAMPLVLLTSRPTPRIAVGSIDLARLLMPGHPGVQATGLLLTQRPSSRQHLDFRRTATYRLRLVIDNVQGHAIPGGEVL